MNCERLDMAHYPRRAHFAFFCGMANPYVGITSPVDVTPLYRKAKADRLPLFLCTLYAVTRAANEVPQLRQRLDDGGIVQYEWCRPSYTVALPDETYCYCNLGTRAETLDAFLRDGEREQRLAMQAQSLDDGEDPGDLLFVSCLPWLSYTAIMQPTPMPADSHPRITWGKMEDDGTRVTMPLTLLAHHALVDGLHITRFFEAFARNVADTFH